MSINYKKIGVITLKCLGFVFTLGTTHLFLHDSLSPNCLSHPTQISSYDNPDCNSIFVPVGFEPTKELNISGSRVASGAFISSSGLQTTSSFALTGHPYVTSL